MERFERADEAIVNQSRFVVVVFFFSIETRTATELTIIINEFAEEDPKSIGIRSGAMATLPGKFIC